MIAKQSFYLHIQKNIKLLGKIVFLLQLVVIGGFVFCFFDKNQDESFICDSKKMMGDLSKEDKSFSFKQADNIPFSLSNQVKGFGLEELKEEFFLIGKNTRPDVSLYDIKAQLGIKNTQETIRVAPGQILYLSFKEGHLRFENTATPLWAKLFFAKEGETKIELGLDVVNADGEKLLEESQSFMIEKACLKPCESFALKSVVLALENSKWWGRDKLFEFYGGQEYQALKYQERIELTRAQGPSFLHVQQGDIFFWEDGEFLKKEDKSDHKNCPLAFVRSVTPYQIEWDVWDESGLEKREVIREKEKVENLTVRLEDVFSKIHHRATSHVFCRLENKPMILKKGDWVHKTKSGWKTLKTLREIEDVLQFKIKGELFVFDGLEKANNGSVFSGAFFDSTRTQIQSVKLPIEGKKRIQYSPHTKKEVSNTIETAPEEDVNRTSRRRRVYKRAQKLEESNSTCDEQSP